MRGVKRRRTRAGAAAGGGINYRSKYWAARTPQLQVGRIYPSLPYDSMERKAGRFLMGEDYKSANDGQKRVRKALGYYGPGDYRSFFRKYIPAGTFASVGRSLGSMTGIPGMNAVGAFAGNKLAKYVGFGDYGMVENQIVGGAGKGQISVNEDNMSGDVYITQTEFVQNISCSATGAGASGFQIVSFGINPGLSVTFPFLSQIAQNYTLYEFEGLMFKFNPTSGENNATSNALGKVIMAVNYDPTSPAFINSVQMENYDYANAAKPSQTIVHGVETKNSQQALNMQYVRTGASSKSLIFTDIGTLYVATEGIPFAAAGTQVLGELWVTYRVKLSRANLYGALVGQNISQDYLSGTTSLASLTTGTTLVKSTNQIGCTVLASSATTLSINFPPNISLGTYFVLLSFQGTFTTQSITSFASPSSCQLSVVGVNLPANSNVIGAPASQVGTTSNLQIAGFAWVTVQAPGSAQAAFVVTVSAALPNGTTWRLWVTQANQVPTLSLT